MRTGRPMAELVVSAEERATLERWVRRRSFGAGSGAAGRHRAGLRQRPE